MANQRYSHVESRKHEGAHYTPDLISNFISEKIIYNAKLGRSVKIADPAVGDGELLISLIAALQKLAIEDIEVHGFDINARSIEITEQRIRNLYPKIQLHLYHKNFLEVCIERSNLINSNNVASTQSIPDFDLLIANPPYIRTQVLGSTQSKELSQAFDLKGRLDIYQAFLVAMKFLMKPNGVAGVIVSNRFMTTEGAGNFREILLKQYSIRGIWDFGDTKVFEAAVLPAVMVLSSNTSERLNPVPFSSVYLCNLDRLAHDFPHVDNQIDALKYSGIVKNSISGYLVKHGHLKYDAHPSDIWRLQDEKSEKWLNKVNSKTWCTFRHIGKVRVGVKTTADNVFIKSDWDKEIGYVPELVRPLTTHHIGGRFKCSEKDMKSILYTHKVVDGKRQTYDIDDYPLSKTYLENHKEQLAGRSYVSKANRKWFEIWVPQNPQLWELPKVVFRDITEKPTFWLDEKGSIVNGDCYWIVCENNDLPKDILWLVLAVANSEFIEEFYDIKFQNKLYSNKRRFITQYVEKFPIPDPYLDKSKALIELAKERYNESDQQKQVMIEREIDLLVWSIFDVPHIEEITKG